MRVLLVNLVELLRFKLWRLAGFLGASWQGVRISEGAHISPRARFGPGVFLGRVEIGSDVTVGEGTYINGGIIKSARIGCFCSLAQQINIGPTDHDYALPSTSSTLLPQGAPKPPPVIGHDVWISARVVILRGVTIGDGAVIGAGVVVNRDIPPYSIVVGVPARVIRPRFPRAADRAAAEAFLKARLPQAPEAGHGPIR